jgi:hypothetical protein
MAAERVIQMAEVSVGHWAQEMVLELELGLVLASGVG